MEDSEEYRKKKAFFASLITLYGRNSVIEVLEDECITVHKLHLSKSNREEGVVTKMIKRAQGRGIEIAYHDKAGLSRISKNAKQDQGVAIDIVAKNYSDAKDLLEYEAKSARFLALDGVHNPQNLGMIIRSAAAGKIDGIILPKKNSAKLSPLVMKASAGTLFKIPIYYCETLETILPKLETFSIYQLSSYAKYDIYSKDLAQKAIYVLGNESEGV
ncbi:MAG: RNA methyltransferase, partial [Campylobacterota bacterium]|nr:RNA methyltransferase [Campylobacterota bacterium]